MTQLVQYLHPLSNGEILVFFVVRERVPLLFEILTAPLYVKLEEERPVVFTTDGEKTESNNDSEV